MKKFDELLQHEIEKYEGRHDDLIYQAPALYRLLTRLLDDRRLPDRLRPLVACAIAYFILPADVISEEIYGPYGYADDIWLCGWVADQVQREVESDDVLTENWDGEAPLMELLRDILAREIELIGEQRDKILRYTGCDQIATAEQKE